MKNSIKQDLKVTTGAWRTMLHLVEVFMSMICPIIGLVIGLFTHIKLLTILSILGMIINLMIITVSIVVMTFIEKTAKEEYGNILSCMTDCKKEFIDS